MSKNGVIANYNYTLVPKNHKKNVWNLFTLSFTQCRQAVQFSQSNFWMRAKTHASVLRYEKSEKYLIFFVSPRKVERYLCTELSLLGYSFLILISYKYNQLFLSSILQANYKMIVIYHSKHPRKSKGTYVPICHYWVINSKFYKNTNNYFWA